MQQLVLESRDISRVKEVLVQYLPGLNPGLLPLSTTRGLLAGPTLLALTREYGASGVEGIFRAAGVIERKPVSEQAALEMAQRRDIASLPQRAPQPADSRLWHLDEVKVRRAWDLLGGAENIDWTGVKVGQVDTGYTRHKALGFAGATWVDVDAGRTMFADSGGHGGPGSGGGVDPLEDQKDGHGTRVASVLCGFDPSAPGGLYLGVAPRVPLVPVRIANNVFISHAQLQLAQALRYLVQEVRVSVVNLSMGFLPRIVQKELKRAIDETYEAGVILVCAAGQPLAQVISPAHERRTIAVAGSVPGSIPWGDSAHGSAVDWSAPADVIFRAEPSKSNPGTDYQGSGDGTSYSTAISSGAAALWVAFHTTALQARYPNRWQIVEAFKSVAKSTAALMPHQQPGSFGAGILNIEELLQAPLPDPLSLTPEANA